jgi:hypothetical protein
MSLFRGRKINFRHLYTYVFNPILHCITEYHVQGVDVTNNNGIWI